MVAVRNKLQRSCKPRTASAKGSAVGDRTLLFAPERYDGPLFLYLKSYDHVMPWVVGGTIPLFSARTYLSKERRGVMTIDEVRQSKWRGKGLDEFRETGIFHIKNCVNVHFQGDMFGIETDVVISDYDNDAYLHCTSTLCSRKQLARFEKTVCLRIINPRDLKRRLDAGMRQKSKAGLVQYTNGPDRGHFLKSDYDAWQCEYRLVWSRQAGAPVWIDLPPGTAEVVLA